MSSSKIYFRNNLSDNFCLLDGVMSYVLFAWEVFQFTSHVSGATSIVSAEKGYNMMMIFASIDFKIHLLV